MFAAFSRCPSDPFENYCFVIYLVHHELQRWSQNSLETYLAYEVVYLTSFIILTRSFEVGREGKICCCQLDYAINATSRVNLGVFLLNPDYPVYTYRSYVRRALENRHESTMAQLKHFYRIYGPLARDA
jgi:hypothetical protein